MNKTITAIVCAASIAAGFLACTGKGPTNESASAKPVISVEQQIKTPTLKKREQIFPPPSAPPEMFKEVAPKQPEAPKEIVPGMPLETPPIPQAIAPKEEETPLAPVSPEAAATPSSTAATPAAPVVPVEELPFTPTLVAGAPMIDIVLDASGSMNAPFGSSGGTKFDAARRAIEDIVIETSRQTDIPRNLGLRLFGADKPIAENDCEDTSSVLPISPLDIGKLTAALGIVVPQGTSPLALAITSAARDFSPTAAGDKVIVLIADGADACGGDACTAARVIHDEKTIVQVIGFDVSADDQDVLRCIAAKGGGTFFLARTEAELRRAIDEALSANVPYNLRLTATAGGSPIPVEITVLKAGTSKAVTRERSFGSKILRLPPGSYDILIEHADSPQTNKPSKLLKGVEILANTKLEQAVAFDIGYLTLSAIDESGEMVPADIRILNAGTSTVVADVEIGAERKTITLSAGSYDINSQQSGPGSDKLILADKGVAVETGQETSHVFRFQRGTLALKAETTQKKPMSFVYQIFASGRSADIVASGAVAVDGGRIPLAPGRYDMIATGQDPELPADPRTKVSNITIRAGALAELNVIFEMGSLSLNAVDDKNQPMPADFTIRDKATSMDIAHTSSDGKSPVILPIPPGSYTVIAASTRSTVEPKPQVTIDDVQVTATEPVSRTATFVLGTLRVRGISAKEEAIRTQFTLYEAGTDEIVATSKSTTDWVLFEVPPGAYDVRATNMAATTEEKPFIRLGDLNVQAGQTISHQAIFTAGQISIIGRGPNNKIIPVTFKIFEYGADREIINGKTGDDWVKFEIPPGRYYLEAGWIDPDHDVTLKKWVNVTIGENEVVEQVLRF